MHTTLRSKIMNLYCNGFRQVGNTMCGPASVTLSAQSLGLEVKDESEWLSPKYSKWMPVKDFIVRGMALHELQFISELIYKNQIEIGLRRAFPENFSLFIKDIKEFYSQQNSILIVNYRQDDFVQHNPLCEHGNPHYSPIMNWNAAKKELEIADVDSAIKKPYWVSAEAMFQSMAHCNPILGIPRGWLVLRKRTV